MKPARISISVTILFFSFLTIAPPLYSQSPELFFKAAGSPVNPKVQVSWNKYNTNDGIADICKKLARAYPDLVTMESAGKSYYGQGHHCPDNFR